MVLSAPPGYLRQGSKYSHSLYTQFIRHSKVLGDLPNREALYFDNLIFRYEDMGGTAVGFIFLPAPGAILLGPEG